MNERSPGAWTTSVASLLLTCVASAQETEPAPGPEAGKLRVFLLAGQSNMEGQAVVDLDHPEYYNGGRGTLVHVLADPTLGPRYRYLRDEHGEWSERDDVWVWYKPGKRGLPGEEKLPREERLKIGGLSIGFAGYEGRHHFGPELTFGHMMGDLFEEPVLLVKTAWGGKSLAKDFRPPSAGGQVGPFYTRMIADYEEALTRMAQHFPEARGLVPELTGFVWFQGWNDMVDEQATKEYESNLVHLIGDVRRDLKAPNLAVVVAETGNCESAALRGAQAAACERAELGGNVAFAATGAFLRKKEDSPNVGHGHHWFGNAESYLLIGDAMGKAMFGLLTDRRRSPQQPHGPRQPAGGGAGGGRDRE